MTLECTLVSGPRSSRFAEPLEVTIRFSPGCSGSELQEALSNKYGTDMLTVGGSPISEMFPGIPPLINGAVLVDGGDPEPQNDRGIDQSPAGLMLAVHCGPGAGTLAALRRGSYNVGRSGADVVIADAELSREHARIEVSDTAVSILDLGSANGTTVDGKRVKRAAVSTGSSIRCGNTIFSLVLGPAVEPDPDGQAPGSDVSEPLLIRRQAEAWNRSALILTAGIPLVIGVALALITGMWMFLAFTAVSAVSVLSPLATGRRQRRELRAAVLAAVKEDEERRRRSAPSAADLLLRSTSNDLQAPAVPAKTDGVWLRVGLATLTANIRVDPVDSNIQPPVLQSVPLRLSPTVAVTTVFGPESTVAGLVNAIIMQLVGLPLAGRTRVLIHGAARLLPLAARFVHRVSLAADESACRKLLNSCSGPGPGPGFDHGVLIIMDDVLDPGDAASLASSAASLGWQVIRCVTTTGESRNQAHGTVIDLTGSVALLTAGTSSTEFTADLVPRPVFDRYLRSMATRSVSNDAQGQQIPVSCSLADVLSLTDEELSRRWSGVVPGSGLAVPIGASMSGPRVLDLQGDGPHLLVAGTTGSGKSELLRSLTASLALCYSPDRVNFLFVDFKGGSGLGPLRHLPHCMGMLTDLSQHQLDRFLVSLRAEIRRRERLLAKAEAPDLSTYQSTNAGQDNSLPHLVLMIDEFRMLVEEAPEALSELMKIAVIGRSLGLHLVMATQRPQGALTPDIRANVTTSIALRVQSEMESADIINSNAAAHISIARPGRAFLVRGTEAPEEFQTASLSAAAAATTNPRIIIQPAIDAFAPENAAPADNVIAAAHLTPAEAAAPLVRQTSALWAAMGGAPIHRPVALPLPEQIPCPASTFAAQPAAGDARRHGSTGGGPLPQPAAPAAQGVLELGWVDLPAEQVVTTLTWCPAENGHLALIGTSAGGVDDAARLAVRQLLAGPLESHLYILDADNSFTASATLPSVGAVASLYELRRGARVLERLAAEMAARLGAPAAAAHPPLLLVVSSWGSWVSAFRSGPLQWAEDVLHDIVRDGTKAGITVVVSGDRELVTARFFASIPNRAYFPAGSTEDSRLAWPRLPAVPSVPGRAVVFGPLVQGSQSVAQFFALPHHDPAEWREVHVPGRPPFRIEPLPTRITVAEIRSRVRSLQTASAGPGPTIDSARGRRRRLLVGVGGDELDPFWVPLTTGSVLAVLGGPSSGKTSLLTALPELNPQIADWLPRDAEANADSYWSGLAAKASSGVIQPAVVRVDDADLLSPAANHSLMDLHELGWTLIVTCGFSVNPVQRVPLMVQARSPGVGILIAPRTVTDGDVFGVRIEREAHPPPGRAVVLSDGKATPVQLGFLDPVPLQNRRSAAGT